MDTLEALTNAAVGLLLSWLAVQHLWPVMGWATTPAASAGVSAFFFALSFVKTRVLRALFRRFG